jgi:hypothetical protein
MDVTQLVSTLLLLLVLSFWNARAEHERAEREGAERERAEQLRAELLRAERELVELRDEQRRLSARIGRIITVEALHNAERCVFALSLKDGRDWRVDGVGVLCGSAGNAVTAAHNLTAAKASPGVRVHGKVYADGAATHLQLEIVRVNR